MGRAPCCDKDNVKKGPWSLEEDKLLKNYIEKQGNSAGSWISLPQRAGLKRCGKSCRLRWLNYLRPDIKHGGYTEEEDRIICDLYKNIGSRWSVIASNLQGRTDNGVKNYWHTKLKKKILSGKIKLDNIIDHPTPSSPSPAMLSPTMSLPMDAGQDVGLLGSFYDPLQCYTPELPMVSSGSDIALPLDYSSWWTTNAVGDDYRLFTDLALGSSSDVLHSGANNSANYSTSDSFISCTSEAKPQGMYHSIANWN